MRKLREDRVCSNKLGISFAENPRDLLRSTCDSDVKSATFARRRTFHRNYYFSRSARLYQIYCTRIPRVQRMHQSARLCHSLEQYTSYISASAPPHVNIYIYILCIKYIYCIYLYIIPFIRMGQHYDLAARDPRRFSGRKRFEIISNDKYRRFQESESKFLTLQFRSYQ